MVVSLVLSLLVAIVVAIFAFQNGGPVVVRFFRAELQVSLGLALTLAAAAGAAAGLLAAAPALIRRSLTIAALRKKLGAGGDSARGLRGLIFALSAAAGAGLLSGCRTFAGGGPAGPSMRSSSTIPAAKGTAKFGKAANGDTSIDLRVEHLADPRKLTPPAENYVVWVRAGTTGVPRNVGALAVDKDLNGRMTAVTALKSFDLFVTAEDSGQARRPKGPALLWTTHLD